MTLVPTTVTPMPDPTFALPEAPSLKFTIQIRESAGLGGTVTFLHLWLLDTRFSISLHPIAFDTPSVEALAGAARIEAHSGLDVPGQFIVDQEVFALEVDAVITDDLGTVHRLGPQRIEVANAVPES